MVKIHPLIRFLEPELHESLKKIKSAILINEKIQISHCLLGLHQPMLTSAHHT